MPAISSRVGFAAALAWVLQLAAPSAVAFAETVSIRLKGGDVVSGELVSKDSRETVIEHPVFGRLVVPASVVRADGREAGEETFVFGGRVESDFIDPTLVAGRWLEPGDEAAVVVNVDVAANEAVSCVLEVSQ